MITFASLEEVVRNPEGAGEGCFRGLYEVSLALVGVVLPGLIPIIEYSFAECNSFL
jgi:hypothetical protein